MRIRVRQVTRRRTHRQREGDPLVDFLGDDSLAFFKSLKFVALCYVLFIVIDRAIASVRGVDNQTKETISTSHREIENRDNLSKVLETRR